MSGELLNKFSAITDQLFQSLQIGVRIARNEGQLQKRKRLIAGKIIMTISKVFMELYPSPSISNSLFVDRESFAGYVVLPPERPVAQPPIWIRAFSSDLSGRFNLNSVRIFIEIIISLTWIAIASTSSRSLFCTWQESFIILTSKLTLSLCSLVWWIHWVRVNTAYRQLYSNNIY